MAAADVTVAGNTRRNRGRHIFKNIQRGVIHALVVVLVVELLLNGERP